MAGTVFSTSAAWAATSFVRAQETVTPVFVGAKMTGKAPTLQVGAAHYLFTGSVVSALKAAGVSSTWSAKGLVILPAHSAAGGTAASRSVPNNPAVDQYGLSYNKLALLNDGMGDAEVDGIITNHSKTTYQAIILIITFYNSSGKLIGTGQGAVSKLPSGASITFQSMSMVPLSHVSRFTVATQSTM